MRFANVPLFILVTWGCNANTSSDASVTVKDTVGVVPDSVAVLDTSIKFEADTALLGFYQGLLPCRDCEGIKQTLLLKDSGRFKLEEFTLGRSTFPKKLEGRWSRAGDNLRLVANQKLLITYYIKKDTLRVGYRDGTPIADSVAKSYWIVRQPDAAGNSAWKQKAKNGIDFYAMGTEPFWSVEIDRERSISFKPAELPKPLVFPIQAPNITRDSTYYRVDSGASRLEVTVFNEFCNDGMSDNLYEHRVHVRYKGQTFKGCGVYLKMK
jgi:uncharacterized membrane protein/uncharacterized lipoprotein NlpE involved in copper resistance